MYSCCFYTQRRTSSRIDGSLNRMLSFLRCNMDCIREVHLYRSKVWGNSCHRVSIRQLHWIPSIHFESIWKVSLRLIFPTAPAGNDIFILLLRLPCKISMVAGVIESMVAGVMESVVAGVMEAALWGDRTDNIEYIIVSMSAVSMWWDR